MHNTYINDLMDCAYPFMAGTAYPFPLSLITGLSLCIYASPEQATTLGISSISIANKRIFVVAVYGGKPLGYFDMDFSNGVRDATFKAYASSIYDTDNVPMAMGHMTIGDIPTEDVTYSGFWRLDPSCVKFMIVGGIDMYSYYSPVYYINGISHEFEKIFSINTDGALAANYTWYDSINSYVYDLYVDVDSLDTWQALYDAYLDDTPVVESIGDISIVTLGPNKVYKAAAETLILHNARTDIYISFTRCYDSELFDSPYFFAITLTGTSMYPTCPNITKKEDGAFTPVDFYPKEGLS